MGWVGRDGIKIIMGDGFATILDNIIQIVLQCFISDCE
jgi:hypothetical protein